MFGISNILKHFTGQSSADESDLVRSKASFLNTVRYEQSKLFNPELDLTPICIDYIQNDLPEWDTAMNTHYSSTQYFLEQASLFEELLDFVIEHQPDVIFSAQEALEVAEHMNLEQQYFDKFSPVLMLKDEIETKEQDRNVNDARNTAVEFGRTQTRILKKLAERVEPTQRLDFSAGFKDFVWGESMQESVFTTMMCEKDDGFVSPSQEGLV